MVRLSVQRSALALRSRPAARRAWLRLLPAILAPILSTHLLSPSHAFADNWLNTSGGFFGDSGNWSAGVPGAGALANFNLPDTYFVVFFSNPINGSLTLSAGNVSFETAAFSQSYTVTGLTSITGGSLTLGTTTDNGQLSVNTGTLSINSDGIMLVNDGSNLSAGAVNVATASAGVGVLDFDNSTFTASGSTLMGESGGQGTIGFENYAVGSFADITMGNSSFAGSGAQLVVQAASTVNASGNLLMGPGVQTGQYSFIEVDGTGSTFTQTGATSITLGSSANSNAVIAVAESGSFYSGTGTITVNKTGEIEIYVGGTFNANGNVILNGGSLQAVFAGVSAGIFNLAAGKNLTAQNGATITLSNYAIPGGSTFTIQSGSSLFSASYFDVGNAIEDGNTNLTTLIVGGAGTSFIASSIPIWGGYGGSGVVTIRNNATASITSALEIAYTNIAGTSGTLNVQSGAQLTVAGDINLAAAGGNAVGVIAVTDGILTQTSGSLTIGSASGTATATLTINNATGSGGTFTSGTGAITVNQNGVINLNAGTFNANGNITLNGGSFQYTAGVFNLANGKNLTAQNGASVNITPNHSIPGGSTFTIQSGSSLSGAGYIDVGDDADGNTNLTTLIVGGSGSSFTASGIPYWGASGGSGVVTIRNNATASITSAVEIARSNTAGTSGTLNVQSGAQLTIAGYINLAADGGNAVGAITVTDGTLTQTSGGTLTIGSASGTGTATLTINNATGSGGAFTSSTGGITVNQNGVINLNAGTFNANANITLVGGSFQYTGGAFNLAAGKNLTAQNDATVSITNGYSIPGGSTFTIQSGSSLSSAGYLDVGDTASTGTATLSVRGTGSSFTASGIPYWGANGGSGVVTIRNNATASINSAVEIARSTTAGTSGTVNVQSGAQLTIAGYINLAADGGNAVGAITVTDGTLTQTSGSLTMGSGSGTGTATLTINNGTRSGGTFTSGGGAITVNHNGVINLSAGIFNANGNITFNGGSFQYTGGSFNLGSGKNLAAQNGAAVNIANGVGNGYTIPGGSTFTIQSGSSLSSSGYIDIGNSASTNPATLIVGGAGTSFTATGIPFWGAFGGSSVVTIRNNATASISSEVDIAVSNIGGTAGTVNVQSAAQLTIAGNIRLAADGGNAVGAIAVTDGILTQTSGGSLTIGSASGTGTATLTINNATGSGGTFTSGTSAITVNQNGAINLSAGTFNANGNITFNGGTFNYTGGSFNLTPGKNLTAQNGATVNITPSYAIPGGSTFTIQSASSLSGSDYIDVGDAAADGNTNLTTLIVGGTGSSFTASDIPYVGANGGSGVVTIRNNATASINSALEIARSTTAGTSGTLNVQSAAQLSVAGYIRLAADGGNAVGTINVTDGTLIQTSGGSLIIGSTSGTGTATLTINNATGSGGTFTTSTGTTTVNQNGVINLNAGTFNANGNVKLIGGTLQQPALAPSTFNLAAGMNLTAQNNALVHFGNNAGIGNGSTYSILSGASLINDAAFTIANASSAALVVDGAGSALSVGADSHWGTFGGIANVTLSSNATASVNGTLFLASGGSGSTAGVLVKSGAQLTTTSLTMATLGGGNSATLTVAGAGSAITVTSAMTIGATGTSTSTAVLNVNTSGTFTSGSGLAIINPTGSLNINGGTFNANNSISNLGAITIGNGGTAGAFVGTHALANNGSLTFNRSNAFSLSAPITGTGTLTQSGLGTTTLTGVYSATGPVSITAGKLAFASTTASRQTSGVAIKMQSLTMSTGTTLDMTNHDLIIGNTTYAAVQSKIEAAFGVVTGPAITTSTSNVLGTGTENTLPIPLDPAAFGLTSWDNVSITEPNSIIVKYTLFGDSTLDGTVNGDDFSVIAGNFGKTSPGISNILASWLMGDVTLDGFVNGDDFSVVAGNFGKGPLGTLDTPDAPAVVSSGGGSSNVPEPTSLALLGIGAAGLLLRRKKR